MAIIAHTRPFVVGVDTHARSHTLAVLTPAGVVADTATFPTTPNGIARALGWVSRRTGGDRAALWAIEGTASYGALLTGQVVAAGWDVIEAPTTTARSRAGRGKSDPLDAQLIAAATLPLEEELARHPRQADGERAAIRILLTSRDDLTKENTSKTNALIALLRVNDLGIDARTSLPRAQIHQIARSRRRQEPLPVRVARAEAVRLASRLGELHQQLAENERQLTDLVAATAGAGLLTEPGIGPISAAIIIEAWSHPGRIRSEAAFAALAGVNPIPASSGNRQRHRLNRHGDRQLNRALHIIAVTRERCDPETRAYVERRLAEGRTRKEIRRCLKRALARRIYRHLTNATTT